MSARLGCACGARERSSSPAGSLQTIDSPCESADRTAPSVTYVNRSAVTHVNQLVCHPCCRTQPDSAVHDRPISILERRLKATDAALFHPRAHAFGDGLDRASWPKRPLSVRPRRQYWKIALCIAAGFSACAPVYDHCDMNVPGCPVICFGVYPSILPRYSGRMWSTSKPLRGSQGAAQPPLALPPLLAE